MLTYINLVQYNKMPGITAVCILYSTKKVLLNISEDQFSWRCFFFGGGDMGYKEVIELNGSWVTGIIYKTEWDSNPH